MSTRCTTHFTWNEDGEPQAIVYRHADGYPEGHGVELQEFFDAVEAQTKDTRFNDPSYLAAKLVVWLADRFARRYSFDEKNELVEEKTAMLDFISVGVVTKDPSDIEYRYVVDCTLGEGRTRPKVTCYEVPFDGSEPKRVDVELANREE